MATVTPKLLYDTKKSGDVPVWEIVTEKGKRIYYERQHIPGLCPIGMLEKFKLGTSTVHVFNVVRDSHGKRPDVFKAKDGYIAPLSWYEKDPTYEGLIKLPSHMIEEADVIEDHIRSDSDVDDTLSDFESDQE